MFRDAIPNAVNSSAQTECLSHMSLKLLYSSIIRGTLISMLTF